MVSVCVEGTVAIPERKAVPSSWSIDTLVYVGSLFVVNSFINALLDSYPVTWLAKVVALLPPVADSFALYRPYICDGISGRGRECTGRMKVIFVDSSWWPRQRMETEKHSISTGTCCGHNRIIGGAGVTVFGLLARNLALVRRLLRVRMLIRPLTTHRIRSVFAVLNGCCLASLLRDISSLEVVFRGFPVLWRSFRKLSEAERWQAVGMVRCGMSYRQTAERFNVSLSVIVRLKQRVNQTESVKAIDKKLQVPWKNICLCIRHIYFSKKKRDAKNILHFKFGGP
jgi:uncharacterized protein YerC